MYEVVHAEAVRCTKWCMQWQSGVRTGACNGSPVYEMVNAEAVLCTKSDFTSPLPVNVDNPPFPATRNKLSCSRYYLSVFWQNSRSAKLKIRGLLNVEQDEQPISGQRAHFIVMKWQVRSDVSVT